MTSRKPIEEDTSFMGRHKRFMMALPPSWNSQCRLVAIALFSHAHDDGSGIYVGVERLIALTGLSRSGVMRALRVLDASGSLKKDGTHSHANGVQTTLRRLDLGRIIELASKENASSAISDTSAMSDTYPSATDGTSPSATSGTQTERYNREKEPRDIPPIVPKPEKPKIPDWIPVEAWNGFLEMRASIKKPLKTEYAVSRIVKALERLRDQGNNPGDVLDQSTMNSYQGVFALKGDFNRGSASSRPKTASQRSDEHAAYMLEKYAGQQP